jgi:hypothetical protein
VRNGTKKSAPWFPMARLSGLISKRQSHAKSQSVTALNSANVACMRWAIVIAESPDSSRDSLASEARRDSRNCRLFSLYRRRSLCSMACAYVGLFMLDVGSEFVGTRVTEQLAIVQRAKS